MPDDLDFGTDALVCVYLGERPTAGWGLDLQTASLVDGELRILARETRPRGTVNQVVTYPADCGAAQPRRAAGSAIWRCAQTTRSATSSSSEAT